MKFNCRNVLMKISTISLLLVECPKLKLLQSKIKTIFSDFKIVIDINKLIVIIDIHERVIVKALYQLKFNL